MRRLRTLLPLVVVLLILAASAAPPSRAQSPAPSAEPSASASPSPTATPVPLPYVVTQSEAVLRSLRDIEADLDVDVVTAQVERGLPELTIEITEQLSESRSILDKAPSLDNLRALDSEWEQLAAVLPTWTKELTSRATQLDTDLIHLSDLDSTWQKTLLAAKSTDTPPEVLERIQSAIQSVEKMRSLVEARRAQVLALQSKVAAQGTRVSDAMGTIKKVRAEAMTLLFVQDGPYLWQIRPHGALGLLQELSDAWAAQLGALDGYAVRNSGRFVLHAAVVGMLMLFLMWAREKMRPMAAEEPALERTMAVFNVPFSTALLLSLVLVGDLYPRSPRLLEAILAGGAIIPCVRLLRQLLDPALYPVLYSLIAFYLTDLTRFLLITVPVLHRLVFLAEMGAAVVFMVWLIRRARRMETEEPDRVVLWRRVDLASRAYLVGFAFAILANVLGYINLSRLIGNSWTDSAYSALILFGVQRVLEGLAVFAMRSWPLSLLASVRDHQMLLRTRLHKTFNVLLFLIWLLQVLDNLGLKDYVFDHLGAVIDATATIGSVHISVGGVLAFAVAVWAAFALSRFLNFILDEDVYPRLTLARGLPYAISTMLHYTVLFVGFLFAIAALGIDMTKFTIVAGAFGVGLGLGLQNVVNNFVSGLILLFERPVNVGDVIEVRGFNGDLRRIGLRASVVRTADGSEVIVPNGQLIMNEVVNWTLSDQRRRVEINIGVDYDCNPKQVIDIMIGVARSHPDVLGDPAPQAILTTFGDNAINFQLRIWTQQYDGWMALRSALSTSLLEALRQAGIGIPYPQLDLHIKDGLPPPQ